MGPAEQSCDACQRPCQPPLQFTHRYCRDCAARWRPDGPTSRLLLEASPELLKVGWLAEPLWRRELEVAPGWLRLPQERPGGPRELVAAGRVRALEGAVESAQPAPAEGEDALGAVARGLGWVARLALAALSGGGDAPPPEWPRSAPLAPGLEPLRPRPLLRLSAALEGRSALLIGCVVDARELNRLAYRVRDLLARPGDPPRAWTEPPGPAPGAYPIRVRPTRIQAPEAGRFDRSPERLEARFGVANSTRLTADPDGLACKPLGQPELRVEVDDVLAVEAEEVVVERGQPPRYRLRLQLRRGEVLLLDDQPGPGLSLYLEQELRRLWRLPGAG